MNPIATEISLQWRAGFYAAYTVVTLLFFLILAALPVLWRESAFELIVLMDPSFMGFFFAGGMVLLERDQGVLAVIVTCGRGFASYWRAKVAALLLISAVVVAVLTAGASLSGFIRLDAAGIGRMTLGLALTVPLFFSIGLTLAGWFPRIIEYFLFSSLLLLPAMLPLIEVAQISLGPVALVSPVWGGMVLLTSLFDPVRGSGEMVAAVGGLLLWNAVAYRGARRSFSRLANQADPARPVGRVAGRARPLRASPDVRLLLRDPVHLMVLAGPLLAAVVLGAGIPWILSVDGPAAAFIPASAAAAVLQRMDHVRSFVLLLGVLMYGMLGGLLILDEKDAGVIPFLRTSPGPRGWYLLRRCGTLLLIHGIALVAMVFIANLAHAAPPAFVLSLLVDAMILPLVFLTLGTFAHNKVQGLAMAKVLNFLVLPPLLMIALPRRFYWLLGLIPSAWGSLMRLSAENALQVGLAAVAGTVYAVGLLALLYRRAIR